MIKTSGDVASFVNYRKDKSVQGEILTCLDTLDLRLYFLETNVRFCKEYVNYATRKLEEEGGRYQK